MSGFFIASSVGGLGLIIQLYLKSLGASTFLISLVTTLNSAGLLLGAWLWGTVSDRVKRRPLLGFLALSLAVLIGLLAFLPPVGVVLGSALFRFIFFSGFGAVAIAIISAASQEHRRAKNLSYVSSARALGFAIGNIVAGLALQELGYRNAFALSAMLPLFAFGLLWLLPSENPVVRRERVGAWRAVLSAGVADLFVATMLRQMSTFGTFALLYVYMDSIGIRPGVMGAISASNTATQVLALLFFGWLADRVGRRPIFLLGFSLSVLTPLVFVFAANLGGMVAGYVTLGISFSSMYVGATAHIGESRPARAARADDGAVRVVTRARRAVRAADRWGDGPGDRLRRDVLRDGGDRGHRLGRDARWRHGPSHVGNGGVGTTLGNGPGRPRDLSLEV